jgi:hypothetical protein
LTCHIFQIGDSLGRDIWTTAELLAHFVNKFGGSVDFLCGDLAQCQLGDRCGQPMNGSFFHQEAYAKTSAVV